MRPRPAGFGRQDLAGIHDAERVEGLLDGAHDAEAVAELGLQIFRFALADAVLAGAGAFHADGARREPLQEGLHRLHVLRVRPVHHRLGVEVAVTGVTGDRCDQPERLDVRLRFQHAFGEAGDRHADVGGERVLAGPGALDRPVELVPRLPQPAPVLLLLGPVEADGALALGDLAEQLDLVAGGDVRAVEFEEQGRRLLESEPGVLVHRVDGRVVHHLHAGDAEAELHGLDHGVAGTLQRAEGADGGEDQLRDAVEAHGELGDDAERAF
jgi:hypothetical protein